MSGNLTEAPRPLGRRGLVLLAALAVTVTMLFALSAPPTASAAVGGFCQSVWLQPYGQANDRCNMPTSLASNHHTLAVQTTQRAGCVALLGYWGEQLDSWVCTGPNSYAYYYTPAWRAPGSYRAAIRNNNVSYGSTFTGVYGCCR